MAVQCTVVPCIYKLLVWLAAPCRVILRAQAGVVRRIIGHVGNVMTCCACLPLFKCCRDIMRAQAVLAEHHDNYSTCSAGCCCLLSSCASTMFNSNMTLLLCCWRGCRDILGAQAGLVEHCDAYHGRCMLVDDLLCLCAALKCCRDIL
jgi:hypothetical protein